LRTPAGRHGIESFFAQFCADELRGPPKVLHAPGHSFSDVARKVVSIINLASVSALETAIGAPVNPLRFRGNVYVEGWPAWQSAGEEFPTRETPARSLACTRGLAAAGTDGLRQAMAANTLAQRPMVLFHSECQTGA